MAVLEVKELTKKYGEGESEVIALAKQCQPPVELETGEIIGGFAHNQVLQLADTTASCSKALMSI